MIVSETIGSYSKEEAQSSKEQNTDSLSFFSLNRRKKFIEPSIQLKRQAKDQKSESMKC